MNHPAYRDKTNWLFLLLILLTIVVYYPGLSGDYMFDDTSNLLQNKALDFETLDMDSLQSAAYSSGAGMLRRPVSMASFALNRFFFGIDPYSHKVVNLVIHILTGCLLFLFSRFLIEAYQQFRQPVLTTQAVRWIPVIVCGMWLVHPLNLSSVLYIVQRMTSLATLFTVAGLCLYVIGRNQMLMGRHGLSIILVGLFVFGGLAVFSKENGILIPLYMLVIEIAVFRFQGKNGLPDKTMITFFSVMVAAPALLALLYLVTHADSMLDYGIRDFTLQERILTESRVLIFYLKMIIMPSVQELGLYHDDFTLSHGVLDPPATLFSLIALTVLLFGSLLLLGKRPLVSLGILWFFTGHALESTIFPLELAHEHRNYLADYGILLAASCALAQAPLKKLAPFIQVPVPLLFILLFSYTTWLRSEQWSDNINHAIYEARHHPESHRAVFSAGRIHARLTLGGHHGSEARAFAYLERAGELDHSGIMSDVTLLQLSYLLDQPVDPDRFEVLLDKLSRYPLSPADIISLRILAICAKGSCKVPPEVMENIFSTAMKTENPKLLAIYGYYTINNRGNFDKGLELFRRAVELDRREPQHWKNLINLLITMRRPDEAEQRLKEFKSADTHGNSRKSYASIEKEIDKLRGIETASANE
ncbi:MAG: tetratricopeptide repeat protein [Pseudomonadota bacterium]